MLSLKYNQKNHREVVRGLWELPGLLASNIFLKSETSRDIKKVYFLNLEGFSSTEVIVFLFFPSDFLIGSVVVI